MPAWRCEISRPWVLECRSNSDDESTPNQYAGYYYRTTTDSKGYFTFDNVRTGEYGLFAWPGEGSPLGDITTNFTHFDIAITKKDKIDLGTYTWEVQNRTKIWQIGTLDRLPCEFSGGCGPYGHALTDDAPADLTYTIGGSKAEDWHYVLSNNGEWTINFKLNNEPVVGPVLASLYPLRLMLPDAIWISRLMVL